MVMVVTTSPALTISSVQMVGNYWKFTPIIEAVSSLVFAWLGSNALDVGFEMEHIRHYWDTRKTAERVYYINQAEAMTQTKPSIEEPPISSVELDEQQPKTFQLPSLLKDASPEMLEASVEQGVKLLDQLKAPLLARVENNPDAEQWVQQIGNFDSLMQV